jgi:hypothetical protein
MSDSNRNITYSRCKRKNVSLSVDADAKNGVATPVSSLLPLKAANTSVMDNNDQLTGELPDLQEYKLLTLC